MSVVLSEHLPLLASAPDGIRKLRGLILELAVRGKLVPQDADDEPASELLRHIAKKRVQLEAEGVCRRSRPMPPVDTAACAFAVPDGWLWVRLADVGHDWGQKTPDADFTYVDVSSIDNIRGRLNSPGVVTPEEAPSRARKLVKRGTVIYSTVRPYLLNIAVIDRDITPAPIASTAFAVIHPLAGISSRFIFWYLRSPVFVRYVESMQTGIAYPAVNDAQFFSGLFPLPPLAEQHRIVAKVDELMALCDRLESEQADSEIAHARLVETLLGTLAQSAGPYELAANWLLLVGHFDTLFASDASLDALKQTILQLAVMGKLVPQNPNDEPASELLKRIAKERARMEFEGGCKKLKPITPEGEGELPFEVPAGWAWASLDVIARKITDGEHISPKKTQSGMMLLTAKHILENGVSLDDPQYVAFEDGVRFRERCGPTVGDVLICSRGTIGRCCVVTLDVVFCLMGSVILVRPASQLVPSYLNSFLKSEIGQHFIRGATKGMAVNALYLKDIKQCMVPFPPFAEQHRIVAKVDELMALCDRLKADLVESRSRQARLADTLIAAALEAA